jgi:hypothetical protein
MVEVAVAKMKMEYLYIPAPVFCGHLLPVAPECSLVAWLDRCSQRLSLAVLEQVLEPLWQEHEHWPWEAALQDHGAVQNGSPQEVLQVREEPVLVQARHNSPIATWPAPGYGDHLGRHPK